MATKASRRIWLQVAEVFILGLVLILAAYLRLANRADNPGWYSDEGTHINIAMNLMEGRVQSLAITQSMLLVARPPLFHLLLAGLFRVWGAGIETLRAFTGGLGVASVILLYLVTRTAQGSALALLSALMLAVYPEAVVYSRIGYSYNLLTPLVLLACWGLWGYLETTRRRWLTLAALALGLGLVSELVALVFLLPFALVVVARRWRDLLWSLPLFALPFGIYAAVMTMTAPQAFLFDLRFTFLRAGDIPLLVQLPFVLVNLALLMARDYWLGPAIVGLFMLQPLRWQRLYLILFWLPLLSLARTTTGLSGLTFHYLTPLMPFVALGVASLVYRGAPHVLQVARNGLTGLFGQWPWLAAQPVSRWAQARLIALGSSLAVLIVVVGPFLASTVLQTARIQTAMQTPIDLVLVDADDARTTADFINRDTGPDDVVIASPAVAWLFHSRVTDFQQVVAASGGETISFPIDIPVNRFAFDVDGRRARFVVVDRIWRNWGAPNMPGVADLMHEAETWPLAFQAGEFYVYQNPAK